MITVISGTNRRGGETLKFAVLAFELLKQMTNKEVKLLSLEDLPLDLFHIEMYEKQSQSRSLALIQNEYMIPAEKFLYVIPEYNGSFPGVLKLFIDACSVRAYDETFKNKKAALLGIASGRAGNLRGMDHLTGVLNHLGTIVMPDYMPLSSIEKLVGSNGIIDHKETISSLEKYLQRLTGF